jgi:deoxyribose-phosphate aldolase
MKPLNKYFDHTLLKPEATKEQIKTLCEEAMENDFYSVCVNSYRVKEASELLKDSQIKVAAVVGFPLGAMTIAAKTYETITALRDGANEIDMVINIGALKDKDYETVEKDIYAITSVAKDYNAIVKVIIETCLLSDEEKIKACKLSEKAGAEYVKTSTGFSLGGAEINDVILMKKTVGNRLKVKASGGIRDYKKTIAMIDAGAERIGASAGVQILKEIK